MSVQCVSVVSAAGTGNPQRSSTEPSYTPSAKYGASIGTDEEMARFVTAFKEIFPAKTRNTAAGV